MILSKKFTKKKTFIISTLSVNKSNTLNKHLNPPSAQTWSDFFVFLASFLRQKIIIFFNVYYFLKKAFFNSSTSP